MAFAGFLEGVLNAKEGWGNVQSLFDFLLWRFRDRSIKIDMTVEVNGTLFQFSAANLEELEEAINSAQEFTRKFTQTSEHLTEVHVTSNFEDSNYLSLFIDSLTAEDAQVRAEAALVLGEIGDERAVPALCQVLATDQNPEVRRNAAEALGMIGSEQTENSLSEAETRGGAAIQIQDLIEQLQNQGMTVDIAQEQVANDLTTQAQNNSTMKDKLVRWGQSLGDATVSDVVKSVVKLAIRSAGIPLP